ncbi:hypothetical protein SAMN04487895_104175 [Paenibacillus sophorae]|uniref:Uncharacterized protein n=1 Tax=Paenibacillus sophorae TaxID=1333845 RepID=A0A1H8L5V6_9BACL|nr:hypothetical protein [Paenibacillus sophorae]QWU17435.1 hypothetical protein KP014_09925 [Paenibacillus sophorae]SEO00068.1 hypothetical protein SAMN04487895_104175 [Paenibacillus sophorae]
MKNHLWIFFICFICVLPGFSNSAVAADTLTKSVALPTQSLTGSANDQKTFFLDLPSDVVAASIKTGTLKYTGSNSVVSLAVENGKIKITLNGVKQTKIIENVQGYRASYGVDYDTRPGNSIWRYSDGVRWQVNKYNIDRNVNDYSIVRGSGSSIPYDLPQTPGVVTRSDVLMDYIKWYNGSAYDVIDNNDIIQSTIRLNNFYPPSDTTVNIKNNQFIISYTAPGSHNYQPEDVPDSVAVGPLVVGRRYVLPFTYHFFADAKVTTYNYSGSVSFEYGLPDDVTLNGTVAVLKPNPNPAKFEDKNVDVQLSLRGELLKYTDSANIQEWVLYAQEQGKVSTLQIKKEFSKTLNTNKTFDFTIPASAVTSDNFQQKYDLRVLIRFKNPITTKNGQISSLEQPLSATVELYKNTPTVSFTTVTPPPTPKGKPPVAMLIVPPVVKAGEDFVASGGGSYDPDGEITGYFFEAPGANVSGISDPTKSTTKFWYPESKLGNNTIGLTVVDDDMMTGNAGGFVQVIKPVPEASLEVSGTKKQNRKVTIINTSKSPTHYPLVDSKTKMTITAVSGGSNADIKYSGSLDGVTQKDVLFKKPGTYKATIYVENTLGYSATSELTFEIVPDEPPTIYFFVPTQVYRDPTDGNKVKISIDDMSFSPDNDFIDQRTWEYRYDSDNDGSFDDESWVIFSNDNEHRLTLTVYEVGRYEIRHTAYEGFGQPTIDAFITSADRQYADSSSMPSTERIITVKNRAPEGDWAW